MHRAGPRPLFTRSLIVMRCGLLLALIALAPAAWASDQKRLAVLEFELAQGVKIDRTYFSDLARGAVKKHAPQLFVMTRESTEALLQANGKTMADCTGECEVEVGRKLGADYIISGRITQIGSNQILTMRLFATADGSLMGDEEARGKSQDQLLDAATEAIGRLIKPLSDEDGPRGSGLAEVRAAPAGSSPNVPAGTAQGTIKVVSMPSGAKVSIDGDAAGATPLTLKKDAGTYVVTIELPGYAPVSRTVELAPSKSAIVNETLMQAAGYIEVGIQPEGAARAAMVTVDGRNAGVGKQGPYKVGKHQVRAESAGYKAAEQSIGVDNGGTAQVQLALEPIPGKLLISVNVAASCSAGSTRAQATPDGVAKLEVEAGRAKVTCAAEGYEDASAEVEVGPGRAQAVKLSLKRLVLASGDSGVTGGRIEPKSGLEFVRLPGGALVGGNFPGASVAPFSLGRTATTVAAYGKCVAAGVCTEPDSGSLCNWKTGRENHPINCVDWNQAVVFCRWIGGRLPKSEEREWAASGGEGRKFPWGKQYPSNQLCWSGEGSDVGNRKTTCPVGAYPAGRSKQGILDLAGNVSEWLDAEYNGGQEVRGGSWSTGDWSNAAASTRDHYHPGSLGYIGFRCAL